MIAIVKNRRYLVFGFYAAFFVKNGRTDTLSDTDEKKKTIRRKCNSGENGNQLKKKLITVSIKLRTDKEREKAREKLSITITQSLPETETSRQKDRQTDRQTEEKTNGLREWRTETETTEKQKLRCEKKMTRY